MKIFDIILVIVSPVIILILYTELFCLIIISSEHRLDIELFIVEFIYLLYITYLYVMYLKDLIKGKL